MFDNKKSLPPLGQLFNQAWKAFIQSFLKIFILSACSFSILGILLVVIALFFGLASFLPEISSYLSNAKSGFFLDKVTPDYGRQLMVAFGIVFIIFALIFTIVSTLLRIAYILIISGEKKDISLGRIVLHTFKLIIPLFLAQIPVFFFAFGSAFLFILPGLIISFLLMFTIHEVVLADKRFLNALKGSVQIVCQHFWDILARMIILVILNLTLMFLISLPFTFLMMAVERFNLYWLSIPVALIRVAISVFIGLFGLCYSVALYQQAREVTDREKKVNLLWFWIISILGWLLLALICVGAYKLYQKGIFNQPKKTSQETKQEEILTFAPSTCGLSIPVPKTTDTYEGKERKWLYEEWPLQAADFYILDRDVYSVNDLPGAFIGYKDTGERLSEDNLRISYSGLNIYCPDNYKSLSLEEYKSLALTNKTFKVTEEDKRTKWGEVELIFVWIEGEMNGRQIKEPAFLGVSKDGRKLLYIRIWGPASDDPFADQINKDITLIQKNLKYRN